MASEHETAQDYAKALGGAVFFYYRCSHCKTFAVTLQRLPGVRCNGCGGTKAYQYDAYGDSQDVIAAATRNGVAHLPLPQPQKRNPCVRCAAMVPNLALRRRPDGLVCLACYQAEEHPVLTKEQMAANVAAYDKKRLRDRQKDDEREARQHFTSTTGE